MATQPSESTPTASPPRALRIWPAFVPLALVGVAQATPLLVEEQTQTLFMLVVFTPLVAGVLLLLWWMFVSRATVPRALARSAPGRSDWSCLVLAGRSLARRHGIHVLCRAHRRGGRGPGADCFWSGASQPCRWARQSLPL